MAYSSGMGGMFEDAVKVSWLKGWKARKDNWKLHVQTLTNEARAAAPVQMPRRGVSSASAKIGRFFFFRNLLTNLETYCTVLYCQL